MKKTYFIIILLLEIVSSKLLEGEKCCYDCPKENEVKYYSIDWLFGKCGECCLDPKDYWKYKIFEPGLTKAENETEVCKSLGYGKYDKTETHGAFSLKVTLDLYNKGNATQQ